MAVPTFVSANFLADNPAAASNVCPLPASLEGGDKLLGFCVYGEVNTEELLHSPASLQGSTWHAFDESNANGSSQNSLVWTEYEPGVTTPLEFQLEDLVPASGAYNKIIIGCVAYRNAGDPVFVSAQEGTGTNATASAITTGGNDSLALALFSGKVSSIANLTGPAGYTQRVNQAIGGGGGVALWMGGQAFATPQSTGPAVAVGNSASMLWYASIIEFPAIATIPDAAVLMWNGTSFIESEMLLHA